MTLLERRRQQFFRSKLEADMNLATTKRWPWGWIAFDADADVCFDSECSCRSKYVQGEGKTEEEAIIDFVKDLLEKRGADLYEVWPGAAAEKKNCNVRLANPFRLKEEPCEKS